MTGRAVSHWIATWPVDHGTLCQGTQAWGLGFRVQGFPNIRAQGLGPFRVNGLARDLHTIEALLSRTGFAAKLDSALATNTI